MAFRFFSALKLLPILTLAPLVMAPKGCHFGSDEVPLGSNAEAGAGPGADGSGGSDTSTTGGTGPASGGSATNGGGSGASTGGSAGSGDSTPATGPCIEELTEITSGDPTPFGFTQSDVQALLEGRHRSTLATRNTAPTNVTLEFVGPIRVFYVESRANPDYDLEIIVECNDHVRAKTFARFVSDDGVFDETFPELELDVGALFDSSAQPQRYLYAGGGLSLERHELRGTYYPPIPDNQCLLALQFDLTISEDEFTGLLIEQLLGAPCGSTDPNAAVLISELGSWRCQGEVCRLPPNDTVVVEAASCDRFGAQITSSGDEASFERSGDVLSRDEGYGCGCATRAEHVMAFTPTSPVELRLCHDDGADGCERFCGMSLSYDLTRAFDRAGTREFRFVN